MDRVAFVTYETPFAPCGGVAAVMNYLPRQLQRAAGKPTIVLTPLHYRLRRTAEIVSRMDRLGAVSVRYQNVPITVNILRYLDSPCSWYFLLPDDPRFFAGAKHPYDVNPPGESGEPRLLRDALLFGTAAAKSLHVLAPGERWTVFLQDWEAATAALAGTDHPVRHNWLLTLHNSYDCKADDLELLAFQINPDRCPGGSVLDRAIPLLQDPLTTVSKQFAKDLTEELLQTKVFATHLQKLFRERQVVGVDNGPFVHLAVPEQPLRQALRGSADQLHEWKMGRREQFGKALKKVRKLVEEGQPLPWGTNEVPWGHLASFLEDFDPQDDKPWFVMGGRDDARQKGYDIAAKAATDFLQSGLDARFLFFPIPGDEGLRGLEFLKRLAEQEPFRKRMLVFPFIFKEGYMAALQGATYGLMPSLYEPFGAANEFYLNGTVGIGRATGGIVEQIVPLRSCESFSLAVARRSNHWHDSSKTPTGILFREVDNLPTAATDWKGLNQADYRFDDPARDRIRYRCQFPLYEAMTKALQLALDEGAELYRADKGRYYGLLTAGIQHIRKHFSWEASAREYAHYAGLAVDKDPGRAK